MRAVEFESTVAPGARLRFHPRLQAGFHSANTSVSWSCGSRQVSTLRGAKRAASGSKQHTLQRMRSTSSDLRQVGDVQELVGRGQALQAATAGPGYGLAALR